MRLAIALVACLGLAGCGGAHDDLKEFVKNSGKDLRGKVEPLPQVKPYAPFPYDAFDIPDPFQPRKIKPTGGPNQPDADRPKELLENFPLANLKMVGSLQQGKKFFGIVKTPDNNLYRVAPGNYIGQDYGRIGEITEKEIKLQETVEDANGNWVKRETSLELQEQ
jgi:type IV pilus assembly protein PilP